MSTNNQAVENFEALIKENRFDECFIKMEQKLENKRISLKYDEEADVLYFYDPSSSASEGSITLPIGNTGMAVRIDKDGHMENFAIENFGAIFITENTEYKPLYNRLIKSSPDVQPEAAVFARSLMLSSCFQFAVA